MSRPDRFVELVGRALVSPHRIPTRSTNGRELGAGGGGGGAGIAAVDDGMVDMVVIGGGLAGLSAGEKSQKSVFLQNCDNKRLSERLTVDSFHQR